MRIALTTIGSRGDIQPYIALGSALRNYGHEVCIATHPWAKDLINSWNLKHLPVGDDIDIHYVAKQFVENSGNNLKGFNFALNFIFKSLRNCHQDFLDILRDVDLVIGHGIVGSAEADILRKPFVSVSIETMGLQKEYRRYGNLFTKSGVYLGDKLLSFLFGRPYLMFRKEIKAPPPGSVKEFPYLALVPISPLIQKPDPFWKQVTEITGFFFAETPETFIPSEKLNKFISDGEKPILITFGSMFHKQEETHRLFQIICDAINHSNTRALLLMPDVDTEIINSPDNLFIISDIPYSWLLKEVSLVIHHFGFGTTAEVLRAGLPSIPVPHIFDQKIRASKIHKMGLCHRPLELGSLSSGKLSDAIFKTSTDTKLHDKCHATGMGIAQENGVEKAVGLIKRAILITLITALMLGISCSSGPGKEKSKAETGQTILANVDEAAFLQNLASLCEKSFTGREIYSKSGRNSWAEKSMVMHVTVCEPTQVHIPFHIDNDKSRTWMFLAEEGKLRFRHDHRHADGTPEDLTLYGGYADGTGNAFVQNFPADEYTKTLLADNIERKWTVKLSEDLSTMSYQLHYAGEMVFEAEFDLTRKSEL